MKIVVIGGSGLIGKRLIAFLKQKSHDAVSASPSSGVNTLTGAGLADALAGADVVVDVSNSPSFEDKAVLEFFQVSTTNLLAAATKAGVKHLVALSVVGADALPDSGYMRAKVVQEELIQAGSVAWTIVRATQFFEFLAAVAGPGGPGSEVRLPSAPMQPIAAEDVSALLADIVVAPPVKGILEIAGPEKASVAECVRRFLVASGDTRTVAADATATYFGTALDAGGLAPRKPNPRLGPTKLEDWMKRKA